MMYKAIKFFGILAMLAVCFQAYAQPKSEEEEIKQMREVIDRTVESYEGMLELDDWQTFYVDSILTHDYEGLRVELKALQAAKMTSNDVYQQVQDKWAEQIYQSLSKVFDERQWNKYLKSGAAREKKARDKRAGKSK